MSVAISPTGGVVLLPLIAVVCWAAIGAAMLGVVPWLAWATIVTAAFVAVVALATHLGIRRFLA